jgi:hypothetical protein
VIKNKKIIVTKDFFMNKIYLIFTFITFAILAEKSFCSSTGSKEQSSDALINSSWMKIRENNIISYKIQLITNAGAITVEENTRPNDIKNQIMQNKITTDYLNRWVDENNLTLTMEFMHIEHASLTQIYDTKLFNKKKQEFIKIINCNQLTYLNNKLIPKDLDFHFSSSEDGNNPDDFIGGLGIFNFYDPDKSNKHYYACLGIVDCVLLIARNTTTGLSFNVLINIYALKYEKSSQFKTFERMLPIALHRIRANNTPDDVEIVLISSYLSTNVKILFERLKALNYITPNNVRVDFNLSPEETYNQDTFIIRNIGQPSNKKIFSRVGSDENNPSDEELYEMYLSMPVTVYTNPSMFFTKYVKPEKNIIYHAASGKFYRYS